MPLIFSPEIVEFIVVSKISLKSLELYAIMTLDRGELIGGAGLPEMLGGPGSPASLLTAMSGSSNREETPFDLLPGLIWACAPDGVCSYFNKGWLEFRGRTLDQEQGDGWMQGIHSEDVEGRKRVFEQAFRARQPFHAEYRLRHRDGSYRRVADEAGPVFDEQGELTGFVGCCVEIRGASEGGDAGSTKGVRRPKDVEALPVLAGIMAHEFNNLLTPILLNLSMAQSQLSGYRDDLLEEVARRLFETEAAAIRAKELSTYLLAFGKGGNPVKQIVDPVELIEGAVGNALSGSGVSAAFSHSNDLRRLDVDRGQFDAVIDRIVANALEAMPFGGVVRVSTAFLEKITDPALKRLHGPQICFRIEDEGPGIRFDVVDRIFDPYFSTRPGAEGLGLTTAQAIVRNHSGEIVAESETGHGAIFKIYLPVAAAPAEQPRESAPARTTGVRGRGRVLVMDDEDLVRSSVAAILKAYGYEVETARDGVEAIDAYVKAREANNPIDCALMDLTIHGGMGGKEAVGRLRQIDPDAKAIVCSGHSNDLIMDKFGMYGFRGAIKKPFQPDELNRLLQELIHS